MDERFDKRTVDETIDNRTMKQKFEEGVEKAKRGMCAAGRWVTSHPVETISAVVAVTAAVRQGRIIYDRVNAANAEKASRLTVYCNDVCGKVHLKHELDYKELKELHERMANGQSRFEALDAMNLIK